MFAPWSVPLFSGRSKIRRQDSHLVFRAFLFSLWFCERLSAPAMQPSSWPSNSKWGTACANANKQATVSIAPPRCATVSAVYLRLKGGHEDENVDKDEYYMYRYRDDELEPVPRNQLKSTDQDFGVDYGAFGFTFDVRARKGPVLIVGMQICSAHGSPYDYDVYTNTQGWRASYTNEEAWSRCGGDTRVNVPDYGRGEYGHLPWTTKGVLVEVGTVRSFYIFSNNDDAAVGYRLVGHQAALRHTEVDAMELESAALSPRSSVSVLSRETASAEAMDCRSAEIHCTDRDEHLEILNGQRLGVPSLSPAEAAAMPLLGAILVLLTPAVRVRSVLPRVPDNEQPFLPEEEDGLVRAFLGILEYEVL